jgi:hypothetical protein
MSKLSRLWDWLLPGLISMSPIGAIAYYCAGAEIETPRYESKRAGRPALAADNRIGAAVLPLARL